MVRTCVIAPINVCRRFSREIKCVFFRVCRIVMCVCVYVGVLQQTKPRFKQNSPPATGRREKINRRQPSARLYLNNAHERKIIIRIKSKVFFFNVSSSALLVFATILLFSSPLSARALGIYFCFVLLSIFFFSFPLPTCLRDFFLFL